MPSHSGSSIGPVITVGHAHGEGRHVVHEEIGEMLGGDDDQRIGSRRGQPLAPCGGTRAWNASRNAGSAMCGPARDAGGVAGRCRRIPGSYAGHLLIHRRRHAYTPARTGPCLPHPVPHRRDVVRPTACRGTRHNASAIARSRPARRSARCRPTADRSALLGGEIVAVAAPRRASSRNCALQRRIAVDLEEKLLHLVQAHRASPQCGMWCEPRLTQTFFGSRNTS